MFRERSLYFLRSRWYEIFGPRLFNVDYLRAGKVDVFDDFLRDDNRRLLIFDSIESYAPNDWIIARLALPENACESTLRPSN